MSSETAQPQPHHAEDENAVEIGEEIQPKDAAGEFKNCIKETLSIVRNVSVKKKAHKEDGAVKTK